MIKKRGMAAPPQNARVTTKATLVEDPRGYDI